MTDVRNDRKARKRAYIAMLEAPNCATDDERGIVIGNRVSQAAVKRSALLSGIERLRGHTSLPGHLSPEEIQLWETANSSTVKFELPLDELVTVLKVADTVGDENCSKWTAMLGKRVSATGWEDVQKADAMLGALLRLPPHLLPSVLKSTSSLDQVLSTFPPPLHLPAICGYSTHLESTDVQQCNAAAALHALALAPSPVTSIRSIKVCNDSPATSRLPAATGALLARAACSLPCLTRLDFCFSDPLSQQWLHNFAACLAPGALRQLATLFLCADGSPASRAELISCLMLLPALTELFVRFQLPDGPASAEVSMKSFTCLAADPARLPNLRKLIIQEDAARGGASDKYSHHASSANSFLPFFSATSLETLSLCTSAVYVPLHALVACISEYPALRSLTIKAELLRTDINSASSLYVFDSSSAAFPPLTSVVTRSSCLVSAVDMVASIASRSRQSLTSLIVSAESLAEVSPGLEPASCLTPVWHRFILELSGLALLKHLDLACICSIPPGDYAQAAFSQSVAGGLACLTNLTFLALRAEAERLTRDGTCFLIGSSIGGAIAAMTALQELHLTSCECYCDIQLEFDTLQPLFNACAGLAGLKHLRLDCEGVTLPQLHQFLAQQRALTYLELKLHPDSESIQEAADGEWKSEYPQIEIAMIAYQ